MLKGLTSTFKQHCNNVELTYSEYIKLGNETIPIKAQLKDDSYENGNFIGTFILKQISFETEATYDFKNKEFEYYKVVNGESIKIGTFISTDITINDTTEIVKVIGMDYGLKTQIQYISSLDYSSGNITLMDVWNECCDLSGLESGIENFTNSDFIVDSDQFSGTGATIRDVFKAIAMSSGTFVKVMNDDKIYLIFNEFTSDIENVEINGSATIQDGYKLVDLQLQGNTTQSGTPTPTSPQPINVVSGRQEVVVCGKNLINGTFRQGNVNGTVNNKNIFCDYNNIVVKNQQYTFSTNLDTSVYKYQIFVNNNRFPKSPSDFEEYTSGWKTTSSFTFTLSVDGYFGIGIQRIDGGNLTPNDVENVLFQLVKGTDTTYEAYTGQSYEINLGKNLFNKANITTINNGSITGDVITSNAISSNYGGVSSNISGLTLEAGTYYISLKVKRDSGTSGNKLTRITLVGGIDASQITMIDNPNITNEYQIYSCRISPATQITLKNIGIQLQPTNVNAVMSYTDIMISKDSNTTYTPYKTPIELCKIGNYQDFIKKGTGINLYDKSTIIEGKYINNTGAEASNSNYYATDYIEVSPDKYLILNGNTFIIQGYGAKASFYNSSKQFISYVDLSTSQNIFKIPSNAKYFRTSIYKTDIDNLYISYEPYGMYNKWYTEKKINKIASYNGEIITTDYISTTGELTTGATIYYVLATPTYTEITDSELIGQLNAIKLIEGLNNVSISSSDLSSPLKISYYNDELDIVEDYTELEDKRDTHPWTCLRLGTTQIEGNNLDYIDQDLVDKYGENWLILNDNPFAYSMEKRQQLIMNIFNQIKEFGYSAFVSKTSFKPYLTSGDIIKFKNRDGEFVKSILLRYNHNNEVIQLEAPSETSATVNYVRPLDTTQALKNTQIIVNQDTQQITSIVQNVDNLTKRVNAQGEDIITLGTTLTQTTTEITASITGVEKTLRNGVEKVKNTIATLDNTGLNISTDTSKISTTMTNNEFKITDSGDTVLAHFGYDETQGISVGEMDNLTIKHYFVAGLHRIETYEEDGEERTGFFYIGG